MSDWVITREAAEIADVHRNTINTWAKQGKIEWRWNEERPQKTREIRLSSLPDRNHPELSDLDEWVSIADAADVVNRAGSVVRRWVNEGKLQTKIVSYSRGTMRAVYLPEVKQQSNQTPRLERHDGVDMDRLEKLYVGEGLTIDEVSDRMEPSWETIRRRLHEADLIQTREEKRKAKGVELTTRRKRVIRYTRWAQGKTQEEWGRVLGVPKPTVCRWETHCEFIDPTSDPHDIWSKVEQRAREVGIDPDNPGRILPTQSLLNLLAQLKLKVGVAGIAKRTGRARSAVRYWLLGSYRPNVRSHYAIRQVLKDEGLWTPPDPIEPPDEPSEPDLSDPDRETIRMLHDGGTNISDLSMMYDLSLSRLSDVIKSAD